MTRVVLYAGFHKTGTSAIQAALTQQRAELKKLGIHYPRGFGKYAQHRLAKFTEKDTEANFLKYVSKAAKKHKTLLLASEFYSELSDVKIKNLRTALGKDVALEVIFSLRRLEKIVPSQYQQFVRVGFGQSLDDYADALLTKPHAMHETKLFWRRHDYSNIIKKWTSVVGENNVHVLSVDESEPKFLVRWFEDFLGLKPDVLAKYATVKLNRSLTAEELQLVIEIQKQLGPERMKQEWVKLYRDRFIGSIVSKPAPKSKDGKLALQPNHHEKFSDLADKQWSHIVGMGVRTYGDWPKPTSQSKSSTRKTPKKVQIRTAARAVTAITIKRSLHTATTKQLVRELTKRVFAPVRNLFLKD